MSTDWSLLRISTHYSNNHLSLTLIGYQIRVSTLFCGGNEVQDSKKATQFLAQALHRLL